MAQHDYDVLIIGAGISGIGAAVHLGKRCPGKSFAILEGRDTLGGTWDLFKYPGIRSDSDMYTLGFNFKPWTARKAIADAPTILNYLHETVTEYNLAPHIHYQHKVIAADWDSGAACWRLTVAQGDGVTCEWTANFLMLCSGYYDYAEGHRPQFAGEDSFVGPIIHPQFWPENLDYAGKRVVVIGSGATAVTLVPSMADQAAQVTMLQRSPTYIVSRPSEDALALRLKRWLPPKWAYGVIRWRNVLLQAFMFNLARKRPAQFKARLLEMVREEIGDAADMAHFTPSYNPWDQRLCLVPDSDLFAAITSGKANIVTAHIDRFEADGIRLADGAFLPADIIVSATGLKLNSAGNIAVRVDGAPVRFAERYNYKGVMFSDVPNLGMTFGYTNASWTLKADLTSEYLCRVINAMDRRGAAFVYPHPDDPNMPKAPIVDFSSGYVQRAVADLPKQGPVKPWRLNQNYPKDIMLLRHGRVDDGVMHFAQAGASPFAASDSVDSATEAPVAIAAE